jgi:hypothetical protein
MPFVSHHMLGTLLYRHDPVSRASPVKSDMRLELYFMLHILLFACPLGFQST